MRTQNCYCIHLKFELILIFSNHKINNYTENQNDTLIIQYNKTIVLIFYEVQNEM